MKALFLRVFVLTLLMLVLWYWAAPLLAPPMALASGHVMHFFFPQWVNGAGWNGSLLVLFTDLPLSTQGEIRAERFQGYANMSMLGMGLPFFIALLVASLEERMSVGTFTKLLTKVLLGALLLLPFQIWSVCFTWLVQVLSERGAYTAQEFALHPWQIWLIGLGAQLGKLVFPVLAPILIWLVIEQYPIEKIVANTTQKRIR